MDLTYELYRFFWDQVDDHHAFYVSLQDVRDYNC